MADRGTLLRRGLRDHRVGLAAAERVSQHVETATVVRHVKRAGSLLEV